MSDIFVSYAREDRDAIRTLASHLSARGWSVWWDRHILAGKDFDEVLEAELDKARAVVVVWSAHSVGSRWVKAEAGEGLKRGLLVPIQLDATPPPLSFRNIQTVSFAGLPLAASSPAFDDLVEALEALIGDLTLPPTPIPDPGVDPPLVQAPQPPRPAVPPAVKPRGTTTWAGWVIAVGVLVAAGGGMYGFLGKTSSPNRGAATTVPPAIGNPPPAIIAPSDDAVREFVGKFLDAAMSGDARRVVSFYADRVDYFAMGVVGPDVILKDKEAYYRRWPTVALQLDGAPSVQPAAAPGARRAIFTVNYRVASEARATSAAGTTTTTLTIALIDGALKIVDQKEVVKATPR